MVKKSKRDRVQSKMHHAKMKPTLTKYIHIKIIIDYHYRRYYDLLHVRSGLIHILHILLCVLPTRNFLPIYFK